MGEAPVFMLTGHQQVDPDGRFLRDSASRTLGIVVNEFGDCALA
jgi:hypothetical protein